MTFRPTAAAMALGIALAAPLTHANAQSTGDYLTGGRMLPTHTTPSVSRGGPATPQPSALPGAQANPDLVTPSSKQAIGAMSPNDALFDAINRGDMTDARDAVNRGAELNARNVLGLTPLDLAIDLGRNDITMFLLSMRGAFASSGTGKPSGQAAASAKSAKHLANAASPPPHGTAAKPLAADPPARRQLVSTDPGTPAPQVGFLGFGGSAHP